MTTQAQINPLHCVRISEGELLSILHHREHMLVSSLGWYSIMLADSKTVLGYSALNGTDIRLLPEVAEQVGFRRRNWLIQGRNSEGELFNYQTNVHPSRYQMSLSDFIYDVYQRSTLKNRFDWDWGKMEKVTKMLEEAETFSLEQLRQHKLRSPCLGAYAVSTEIQPPAPDVGKADA